MGHKFYDDYEDYGRYEDSNFQKFSKKSKSSFKGKGHYSKHQNNNKWDSVLTDDYGLDGVTEDYEVPTKTYNDLEKKPVIKPTNPSPVAFGPNTHVIKNNQIDFDRLADIQKVEADHDNKKTYGIKFVFKGAKGSFRIAWFNVNERERDAVYNKEFAFWGQVKNQNKY